MNIGSEMAYLFHFATVRLIDCFLSRPSFTKVNTVCPDELDGGRFSDIFFLLIRILATMIGVHRF
jgi:hypothetical protein